MTINDAAIALGSSSIVLLIVKATAVVGLALLAVALARGTRAAARHLLLSAAFAVLLVLPIASLFAPPMSVGLPTRAQKIPLVVQAEDAGTRAPAAFEKPGVPVTRDSQRPGFSISAIVLMVWVGGTALFLVPMIVGLWQVRSLRRFGLLATREEAIAARLAYGAGIRRRVEVLLHEKAGGPMTCGILRPVIMLPPDAAIWSKEELSRSLLHELEHVRRGDWFSHCLARAVCAIYWFHPMVWLAWRRLALDAERSCDDAVIEYSDATAYAEQLVELARRLSSASKPPLLAMAGRSDLQQRVGSLLDARQRRGRAGAIASAVAIAAAILVLVVVSPLKIVAAAQTGGGDTPANSRPAFEVASIKPHKKGDDVSLPRFLPGGRMTESGVPLQVVIAEAYGIPFDDGRLTGGPDWIRSLDDAYDIEAKAEDGAVQGLSRFARVDKMRLMLQSLLADRFKLVIHSEIRERPVYVLTVAKNGPKLRKSSMDEKACEADLAAACGSAVGGQGRGIHAKAATIADIVYLVSHFTDRPLLNRTGLSGLYDVDTDGWVPMNPRPPSPPTAGPPNPEVEALADSSRPTLAMIFAQLGLNMAPGTAPVESFVIDSVQKPDAN